MRDEGILKICTLENIAEDGAMPKEKLVKVEEAFYAVRTIGYNRRYAAKGANTKVDELVRVYNAEQAETGLYVVLNGGRQFQIESATRIVDEDATDLELVRVENYYEVAE